MSEPDDARTFHFDEGVISVPAGFRDRSAQRLEWAVDNSSSLTLSIQRERLEWGSFDDFVSDQTREYPSRFLGFKADDTEYPDPFDGGIPLRRVVFRYKGEHDVVYDHQAFVLSRPLVLIVTVTAKAIHRERADELMKSALSNLRFREH